MTMTMTMMLMMTVVVTATAMIVMVMVAMMVVWMAMMVVVMVMMMQAACHGTAMPKVFLLCEMATTMDTDTPNRVHESKSQDCAHFAASWAPFRSLRVCDIYSRHLAMLTNPVLFRK